MPQTSRGQGRHQYKLPEYIEVRTGLILSHGYQPSSTTHNKSDSKASTSASSTPRASTISERKAKEATKAATAAAKEKSATGFSKPKTSSGSNKPAEGAAPEGSEDAKKTSAHTCCGFSCCVQCHPSKGDSDASNRGKRVWTQEMLNNDSTTSLDRMLFDELRDRAVRRWRYKQGKCHCDWCCGKYTH